MIEINSVSKSFDDKKVFENFSEKIEKGEFIIFSGESGCGKTTLLNMIGGIEKIDKGTITVDGIDISQRKNKLSYFQNKVGFLFQNFALVEEKTVEQNLTIVRGAQTADILKVLERVGLKGYENKKVYKLSGGEQQRVALARLMLKSCDLILADEPTGSLDKKNAMLFMDILKELNKENKTIILVTHDEEIKKMGTRTITLGEGK